MEESNRVDSLSYPYYHHCSSPGEPSHHLNDRVTFTEEGISVTVCYQSFGSSISNAEVSPNEPTATQQTHTNNWATLCNAIQDDQRQPLVIFYSSQDCSGALRLIDPSHQIHIPGFDNTFFKDENLLPQWLLPLVQAITKDAARTVPYTPEAISLMLKLKLTLPSNIQEANAQDAKRSLNPKLAKKLADNFPPNIAIGALKLTPTEQHAGSAISPGSKTSYHYNKNILSALSVTYLMTPSPFMQFNTNAGVRVANLSANTAGTNYPDVYVTLATEKTQFMYRANPDIEKPENVEMELSHGTDTFWTFRAEQSELGLPVTFPTEHYVMTEKGIHPCEADFLNIIREYQQEVTDDFIANLASRGSITECVLGALRRDPKDLNGLVTSETPALDEVSQHIAQMHGTEPIEPAITLSRFKVKKGELEVVDSYVSVPEEQKQLLTLHTPFHTTSHTIATQPAKPIVEIWRENAPRLLPYTKSRAAILILSIASLATATAYMMLEKLYWQYTLVLSGLIALFALYQGNWLHYLSHAPIPFSSNTLTDFSNATFTPTGEGIAEEHAHTLT